MILDHFDALDRALVAAGFPPTSPWWCRQIERFYRSGRRQFVLRVGRRGGKSSTLCRIAVLEALYGEHNITPGDVGYVAILSVDRGEAARRLRTVRSILDALHVPYSERSDTIELKSRPVAFQVMTASLSGTVGATVVCAVCDETARWRDTETGANPASQVIPNLRASLATMPNARMFLSSSPWGIDDAHANAFDLGDTDSQLVAHAATWTANPTLTEDECRALEPHEPSFNRNFGAIPTASAIGAIDVDGLAACVRPLPGYAEPIAGAELVLDASGGRFDAFTAGLFQWIRVPESGPWHLMKYAVDDEGNRIAVTPERDAKGELIPDPAYEPARAQLYARCIFHERGRICESYSTDDVARLLANETREEGVHLAHGDQFAAWSWESDFRRHGVRYVSHNWDNPSKGEAIVRLRQMIRERTLIIEPGEHADALVDESRRFVEKILPSGLSSFGARTGHDDRVMCLLLAARVDSEAGLKGSPLRLGSARHETYA